MARHIQSVMPNRPIQLLLHLRLSRCYINITCAVIVCGPTAHNNIGMLETGPDSFQSTCLVVCQFSICRCRCQVLYVFMYVYMHARNHGCMNACMYVCMYVCIHTWPIQCQPTTLFYSNTITNIHSLH